MKAFDAAESGKYNSDGDMDYWAVEIEDKRLESRVRGSNLWCDSNIRSWLNSEKENVVYEDQAPTASAMSEKKNGYSNEAGFLHGFTEEEKAVLRETQVLTIGNVLMDSWGTETKDRVFLLSQEELEWFGEADISLYAVPTDYALEQDQTGWYEGYSLSLGVKEYPWLLRILRRIPPVDAGRWAMATVTMPEKFPMTYWIGLRRGWKASASVPQSVWTGRRWQN